VSSSLQGNSSGAFGHGANQTLSQSKNALFRLKPCLMQRFPVFVSFPVFVPSMDIFLRELGGDASP
jgi:hypothetical protein